MFKSSNGGSKLTWEPCTNETVGKLTVSTVHWSASPFITLALCDPTNYSSADICLQTQHFTHLLVHKHLPLNSGCYQKGVVFKSSARCKTNCYTRGSQMAIGPRGHFRVSAKHSLKLWPPLFLNAKAINGPLKEKASISGGGVRSQQHKKKTTMLGNAWACAGPRVKRRVHQP